MQKTARNIVVIDCWPLRKLLIKFHLLPGMLQCHHYESLDLGNYTSIITGLIIRLAVTEYAPLSDTSHELQYGMSRFLQMPIACLTVHQAQGSDLMIGNLRVHSRWSNPFSGNELWAQSHFQHPAHSVSSVISKRAKITLKRPKQKRFKCHCVDTI